MAFALTLPDPPGSVRPMNTHLESAFQREAVRKYWEAQACGTEWSSSEKFSVAYFDEVESFRYAAEPFIASFAQFAETPGLDVLEVGVGAGTDFLQWVRAGARAYGIDLTYEAAIHVRRRLAVYRLDAEVVSLADCESLPFAADRFDLVYSWGVIHHTPNPPQALAEIVRVCRAGGTCKLMLYHRHSLLAVFLWIRWALLRARPWMSVSDVISGHMESVGTRAYTREEVRAMVASLPVTDIRIESHLTRDDRLAMLKSPLARRIGQIVASVLGHRAGWFLTVQFRKASASG